MNEREKYIKKMWNELLKVQMNLVDDNSVNECAFVDFNYSPYYFNIKLLSTDRCTFRDNIFSCKSLEILKKSIEWVFNNTEIHEVTAFVKGSSYVTFRSQRDIDLFFDYYYKN